MEILFEESFEKDIHKIEDIKLKKRLSKIIKYIESIDKIRSLSN